MRHRKRGFKLSRSAGHRRALRKNLIADLLAHEEIVTTEAKARMLRPEVERVITIAKRGLAKDDPIAAVHARRVAVTRLNRYRVVEEETAFVEIDVVQKLFDEIAPRYTTRPGGYTRMIKLPRRAGDNAKMALVQLVEGTGDSATG